MSTFFILLLWRRLLADCNFLNIFKLCRKWRRILLFNFDWIWQRWKLLIEYFKHRWDVKLKRRKILKISLVFDHLWKWIVLIRCLALIVFVIWVLICYLIKSFQVMEIRFIKLRQFHCFYLIIFSETEIISIKFVQNIIEYFFSIVHLFACFDCYSWESKLKLKQNESGISFMLQFRIV